MNLIIDGNNLAYRANVTTELHTKQGEKVSAIYGFLQMMQSYIKPSEGNYKNKLLDSVRLYVGDENLSFNRVVNCFDAGRSKQRMELYPEYKGSRDAAKKEKTEEEQAEYYQFIDQMEQLHVALPKFGVKSLKVKGWEGDDLVYVMTKMLDDICVVVSTDKDMLQLVSDKVFIWSPFKEQLITPRNFTAVVGVPQESFLSYRILVGDPSDNIHGVKGIGDKTAKGLLEKYDNIEGIIANQGELMKSKRTARIFEDLSLLERNNKLMNLSYVDYSEIQEYLDEVLDENTCFQDAETKKFLASKQFVKILADFIMWSMPFRLLG